MFIMSQFRGCLKLWNYFLMLTVVNGSVHRGLQLCQDASDPIWVFAGIIVESLVQFDPSQRAVPSWFWQVYSLERCIHHHRQKTQCCWKTDEWSIFKIFYYNSSYNFEGDWYPNGGSVTLHLHVWLPPASSPATASALSASKQEAMWHLPPALETLPECNLVSKRTKYLIFWVWQVMIVVLV